MEDWVCLPLCLQRGATDEAVGHYNLLLVL